MASNKPEPAIYEYYRAFKERMENGVVVVSDRPVHEGICARTKRLLSPYEPDLKNTVLQGWEVFEVEIPPGSYTGKHRHQGGIAIFILEGKGYTIIEGKRFDWKAGDLVLLPLLPGGVGHQHFNADDKKPVRYIPFGFRAMLELGGYVEIDQMGTRPEEELVSVNPQALR